MKLSIALVLGLSLGLGLCMNATGQTVQVPGYSIAQTYPIPTGVGEPVSSLFLDPNGVNYYIISNSEQNDAELRQGTLTRDGNGAIVSFSPTTQVMAFAGLDAGNSKAPGSDTLFFTLADPDSGDLYLLQRNAAAATTSTLIDLTASAGGLGFIPSDAPAFANDLLIGLYNTDVVRRYTLSPDANDFFTVTFAGLFADLSSLVQGLGDVDFLTHGPLAGNMVVAAWDSAGLYVVPIDPNTGLPVGGANNPSVIPFVTGIGDGIDSGPWGLEIDPITGDLFAINWDSDALGTDVIIRIHAIPEPASLSVATLGSLALLKRRRPR